MATEESISKGIETLLLRGWAEIAWFLDCSETTAKRYHYLHSMPVFWVERVATAIPMQLKIYLQAYTEAVRKKS
jgi:hypothetical protein